MKETFKLFGSEYKADVVNYDNKFDDGYAQDVHDETMTFIGKDSFKVYLDDDDKEKEVSLRLVIECCFCEGKKFFGLFAVPCKESLGKEKVDDIASSCGVSADEVNANDIFTYGCSVLLGNEETESSYDDSDWNDADFAMVNRIASVSDMFISLIGLYLDRYQNRVGSTGWDLLNDFCLGKDFLDAAMERYKKEKGNE